MKNSSIYPVIYTIRREFYKITSPEILEGIDILTPEKVEYIFQSKENESVKFSNIQSESLGILQKLAKKLLSLSRGSFTEKLIYDYMLYYEFYNLNILLKARINNYEGELFLFDWSRVSSKEELLSLKTLQEVQKTYLAILSAYRISDKRLLTSLKTVSKSNIREVLLYSSIVYYRNLLKTCEMSGSAEAERIISTKAFYEFLISLAKIRFIENVDVENVLEDLDFLPNKQILQDIFLVDTRENFLKKCVDKKIIPQNFLISEIDDIDKFKNIILKNTCKSIIIGFPLNIASLLSIFILREIDVKNYTALVGAALEGLEMNKVRSLVVL